MRLMTGNKRFIFLSMISYLIVYFSSSLFPSTELRALYLIGFLLLLAASVLTIRRDYWLYKQTFSVILLAVLMLFSIRLSTDTQEGINDFLGFVVRVGFGYTMIHALIGFNDKTIVRIFSVIVTLCIATYFLHVVDKRIPFLTSYGITGQLENVGASLLIIVLPFLLLYRKYVLSVMIVAMIFTTDSRAGAVIAFGEIVLMPVILYACKIVEGRRIVQVLGMLVVGVVAAVCFSTYREYLIGIENLGPGDLDFVRHVHNYWGLTLLADNWFWGVGLSEFQNSVVEVLGREITPHGFLFYFWVDCGVFAFVVFLIASFFAVSRCLQGYEASRDRVYLALFMANTGSFLFFITRPQQDSIFYYSILLVGLACPNVISKQFKNEETSSR